MKKKKQFNKEYFLIAIMFILIAVFFIIQNSENSHKYNNQTVYTTNYKAYNSKTLKISFNIPSNFQIKESFNSINIQSSNGKIMITRQGTNYENLENYLENLSELNNFQVTSQEDGKTEYDSLLIIIDNNKKSYLILPTPWTVYSISTSSQELYDELDEIAKSFRYTP